MGKEIEERGRNQEVRRVGGSEAGEERWGEGRTKLEEAEGDFKNKGVRRRRR